MLSPIKTEGLEMNRRQKQKQKKKYTTKDELIIDVSARKKIRIELADDGDSVSKANLDELRKEFADISNDVKNMYYSSNAIVERVEKRRFLDLIKLLKKMPRNKNAV